VIESVDIEESVERLLLGSCLGDFSRDGSGEELRPWFRGQYVMCVFTQGQAVYSVVVRTHIVVQVVAEMAPD